MRPVDAVAVIMEDASAKPVNGRRFVPVSQIRLWAMKLINCRQGASLTPENLHIQLVQMKATVDKQCILLGGNDNVIRSHTLRVHNRQCLGCRKELTVLQKTCSHCFMGVSAPKFETVSSSEQNKKSDPAVLQHAVRSFETVLRDYPKAGFFKSPQVYITLPPKAVPDLDYEAFDDAEQEDDCERRLPQERNRGRVLLDFIKGNFILNALPGSGEFPDIGWPAAKISGKVVAMRKVPQGFDIVLEDKAGNPVHHVYPYRLYIKVKMGQLVSAGSELMCPWPNNTDFTPYNGSQTEFRLQFDLDNLSRLYNGAPPATFVGDGFSKMLDLMQRSRVTINGMDSIPLRWLCKDFVLAGKTTGVYIDLQSAPQLQILTNDLGHLRGRFPQNGVKFDLAS